MTRSLVLVQTQCACLLFERQFSHILNLRMVQRSTLVQVADIVINRVLRETKPGEDLARALNDAYPFGDDPHGREVWLEALIQKAVYEPTSH